MRFLLHFCWQNVFFICLYLAKKLPFFQILTPKNAILLDPIPRDVSPKEEFDTIALLASSLFCDISIFKVNMWQP